MDLISTIGESAAQGAAGVIFWGDAEYAKNAVSVLVQSGHLWLWYSAVTCDDCKCSTDEICTWHTGSSISFSSSWGHLMCHLLGLQPWATIVLCAYIS